MSETNEGGRIKDPIGKSEDKSLRVKTSQNREESMKESGSDAFGDKSSVRNPETSSQGDGTSEPTDEP